MAGWSTVLPDLAQDGNTVRIRSTRYGIKLFLGRLTADRLVDINLKRQVKRERIGLEEMNPSELAEKSKACPICSDIMGIPNLDGLVEKPIKLVCCSQVFGNQWYGLTVILTLLMYN